MQKKVIKVKDENILYVRSAAIFVQLANKYKCNIRISKNELESDGKSITGVLTVTATHGSEFIIYADGEDELEATDKLSGILEQKKEDL